MKGLLLLLLLWALGYFITVLMVMWSTWALLQVGYVDHALNVGDSATLALPLFVAMALGIIGSGSGS